MELMLIKSELTGHTLRHLSEWIDSLDVLMNTPDWPFETIDNLAYQLELWREEYQTINAAMVGHEQVKILTYGEEVILICDEVRGEFIKLSAN